MSFMDAIKTCFSKYFDFSGRARRSEFWWFVLFFFVAGLIPFVGLIVTLAGLIPYFAVAVRRLHDTDRSGWWLLASGIPALIGGVIVFVGFGDGSNPNNALLAIGGLVYLASVVLGIMMIVWLATDTMPGPNRYGPSPK